MSINLDAIEDRHIAAFLPKASKSDLIDSVADVTDLLAEVRYLRVRSRRLDRLLGSGCGAPLPEDRRCIREVGHAAPHWDGYWEEKDVAYVQTITKGFVTPAELREL